MNWRRPLNENIKIETIYKRDPLVQISAAWFHTWEDNSEKIVMKTLFEKQLIKEVIFTLIASEQSKLWKYWASFQDWRGWSGGASDECKG